MAKAPLSQTLFLTEDGSKIDVTTTNAVNIPPPPVYSVANVLASSTRLSRWVVGEPDIYAARYPQLAAEIARRITNANRRDALAARFEALEP
ncbi:hypothetical protein [Sphingomonas abaci]|uniref:Uncharacterized protein n=1 Tax=Sphingomonas abaci TaxID=237611 RepID=A0A7W7EZQ9_9SPHN|nr:hypothetical protein [Sphingomonas abaci]MBB4619982.1 hypothetical protein [Sphingomonas abaci]